MTEEILETEIPIYWGEPPDQDVERRGIVPRLIIVDSPHHRIQEQLEQLNHIMRDEVNHPIIIFTHQGEVEMRHSMGRVLVLGLMGAEFLRIRECIHTPLIVGVVTQKEKPVFTSHVHHHQTHKKSQSRMNHNLPMQRFLPRGIVRDGRGRPERMKAIRSRISVRNGSRK